nr:minor capsid protein [Aneurinibacillus sp. XH2]
MKSALYWKRRTEAIAKAQHQRADQYIAKELYREYDRSTRTIQRDIDVFYQRYAINNEISLAEARKLLTPSEVADFKMTLEEFIEKAKNNEDGQWTKELNNVYFKTRISRLQALQVQIDQSIRMLGSAQNAGVTGVLLDTYLDTHNQTLQELQKGIGNKVAFAKVDAKKVENIVKKPWLAENYSTRIWTDSEKLSNMLKTEISQALIRGDSNVKTAKVIADRMGVGFRSASRLVRTEASHIQSEAAFDSYKNSGVVKKFEFVAALDERTCPICGGLDGHVFTFAEKETGVNIPPVHPNCRCTIVPYFDD